MADTRRVRRRAGEHVAFVNQQAAERMPWLERVISNPSESSSQQRQKQQQQVSWVRLTMNRQPPQHVAAELKRAEALPSSAEASTSDTPLLGSRPHLMQHFVWRYTSFVSLVLGMWVLYLILPKGLRFHYCGAYRRRYAKTTRRIRQRNEWPERVGIEVDSMARRRRRDLDVREEEEEEGVVSPDRRHKLDVDRQDQTDRDPSPSFDSSLMGSSVYGSKHDPNGLQYGTAETLNETTTPSSTSAWRQSHVESAAGTSNHTPSGRRNWSFQTPGMEASSAATSAPTTGSSWFRTGSSGNMDTATPSDASPRTPKAPSQKIILETMSRLRTRGVRLVAHGVQCEPKRVWIKIEEETASLTWQTEFPRRVPNSTGEVSLVLMRGSLHKIALPNVLYIDVGKKTNAHLKMENGNVSDGLCFSLLTQNGSLDLQTNSTLERDALVVCFSQVLDMIHTEDWRAIYEESPAPSQVASHTGTGSSLDPYPSDVVML